MFRTKFKNILPFRLVPPKLSTLARPSPRTVMRSPSAIWRSGLRQGALLTNTSPFSMRACAYFSGSPKMREAMLSRLG